jgi:hypothetical protein
MTGNMIWWFIELIIWYTFFYLFLFAIKNPVNIGLVSLVLLLLASFGVFASPLTRHLSIWNKILDRIITKEEEKEKY